MPDAHRVGNCPRRRYLDRQRVASLAAKGVIEPLDSCVEDQNVDLSQYRKAAVDEVRYARKLYALPEFTNQRTLIVSDAAVHAEGLKPDLQTSDWDALRVTAKRLAKVSSGDVSRIGFDENRRPASAALLGSGGRM